MVGICSELQGAYTELNTSGDEFWWSLRFLPYTWPTFAWSCPANGVASLTTLSVPKGRCFSFSYAWVLLIEKVILFHWTLSSHAPSLVPGRIRPQLGYFLTGGSSTVDLLVQAGRPYSCPFWGNKSKCVTIRTLLSFFTSRCLGSRLPLWPFRCAFLNSYQSTRRFIQIDTQQHSLFSLSKRHGYTCPFWFRKHPRILSTRRFSLTLLRVYLPFWLPFPLLCQSQSRTQQGGCARRTDGGSFVHAFLR